MDARFGFSFVAPFLVAALALHGHHNCSCRRGYRRALVTVRGCRCWRARPQAFVCTTLVRRSSRGSMGSVAGFVALVNGMGGNSGKPSGTSNSGFASNSPRIRREPRPGQPARSDPAHDHGSAARVLGTWTMRLCPGVVWLHVGHARPSRTRVPSPTPGRRPLTAHDRQHRHAATRSRPGYSPRPGAPTGRREADPLTLPPGSPMTPLRTQPAAA